MVLGSPNAKDGVWGPFHGLEARATRPLSIVGDRSIIAVRGRVKPDPQQSFGENGVTRRERQKATLYGRAVDRPAVNFYEIGGFAIDPSDLDSIKIALE
jgi:hypothetical protein